MSPREEVQNEIRDTLVCLALDDVYGILDGKHQTKAGKSYRSLTFCRAGMLDGEVQIFGPYFILVRFQTTIRTLPHKDTLTFKNSYDCKRWLVSTFGPK